MFCAGPGLLTPLDPNWDSVVFLLHCQGVNTGTSFPDNSPRNVAWTAHGNAQTDTSQSPFGGSSMKLDGAGDSVNVGGAVNVTDPTGDFTLDLQFRPNAIGINQCLLVNNLGTGVYSYQFFVNTSNKIIFSGFDASGVLAYTMTSTTAVATGNWYPLRGTRKGNTFTLFMSGAVEGTASSAATLRHSGDPVTIGTQGDGATNPTNGWISEVRGTMGVARDNGAAYTPSLAPFPNQRH